MEAQITLDQKEKNEKERLRKESISLATQIKLDESSSVNQQSEKSSSQEESLAIQQGKVTLSFSTKSMICSIACIIFPIQFSLGGYRPMIWWFGDFSHIEKFWKYCMLFGCIIYSNFLFQGNRRKESLTVDTTLSLASYEKKGLIILNSWLVAYFWLRIHCIT